jgi:2-keto-3-deoxy-L-fuconate dehydrogenase
VIEALELAGVDPGTASYLGAALRAALIATDIDRAGLESIKGEAPRIEIAHLDVLHAGQCAEVAHRWPRIDVLLNIAGYVHNGTMLDCTPEDWARSFDINVNSIFRIARAVLPGMLERGAGSIINMSAVASSIKGVPNRAVYGATKAAVIGLTKAIAADFVGKGIRCNAICPGTVETPSLAGRMAATGDLEAARRAFIARQPMQRLGKPEETAALAVYLGSDESATTGQTHIIDGGWIG